jgi:hypothetical protein
MSAPLTKNVAERFSRILRRLSSEHPGEREAAAHAIHRFCASENVSITDLAMIVENGDLETAEKKYTDEDAAAIFARGVEKGRSENRGVGLSADYFDENGTPRWQAMTEFCLNSPGRAGLRPNEQEFIDEMQFKLQWRSPTRLMGGFMLSIFWKLGGSFT